MNARFFTNTTRCMQRLGYLKHLAHLAASRETSDFETLGKELLQAATRRVTVSVTPEIKGYVHRRLTDRVYNELKKKLGPNAVGQGPESVNLEIQDVYLASDSLPSRTGKLVLGDWRKYTLLGTLLGLVREGTYSALVRGISLLSLCSNRERIALTKFASDCNPFAIRPSQALFLLYCFIERDGDVVRLLFRQLFSDQCYSFSDREAGDYLPEVYREIERAESRRSLAIEDREKLEKLLRLAESISKWKGKTYTGGGAREEAIRCRLEPYVDLGLLEKPDPFRYQYNLSNKGYAFFSTLVNCKKLGEFLQNRFFSACAPLFSERPRHRKHVPTLVRDLYKSWIELKSKLGYAPILEISLLTLSRSISKTGFYFELTESFEALRRYQKEHPDCLRFSVDRMGNLAHVRYLKKPTMPPRKETKHE